MLENSSAMAPPRDRPLLWRDRNALILDGRPRPVAKALMAAVLEQQLILLIVRPINVPARWWHRWMATSLCFHDVRLHVMDGPFDDIKRLVRTMPWHVPQGHMLVTRCGAKDEIDRADRNVEWLALQLRIKAHVVCHIESLDAELFLRFDDDQIQETFYSRFCRMGWDAKDGESGQTVGVIATTVDQLGPIHDIIHDCWFDVTAVTFDPASQRLSIPFDRANKYGSHRRGIPSVLIVHNVNDYKIHDTQHVGAYDFNVVKYRDAEKELTIETGIPLEFTIHVRSLYVEVAYGC